MPTPMIPSPCYIAGPMTGLESYNFPAFDEAEKKLELAGTRAISPANLDRRAGFDPLKEPNRIPTPEFIDRALRLDVWWILNEAKAMIMLPGWQDSTGAQAEYHLARWLGLPIYSYPDMNQLHAAGEPGKKEEFPIDNRIESLIKKAGDEDFGGVSTWQTLLKETNPKDAVGVRKAPMSCVPTPPLMECAVAMMEGARKYGRHNWRDAGVRASVYYDAIWRHIAAWWEGEDIDPASDVSHLTKAICCLLVLRDAQIFDNWEDDRPPSNQDGWIEELNQKASALVDSIPDPRPAFTK